MMVKLLMIAFGLGAILDFVSAIFGMAIVLQAGNQTGYVVCVVTAFILLSLRLCTKTLSLRNNLLYRFIFFSLIIAILLDFYAISIAVIVHIIQKQALGSTPVVFWKEVWNSTATPVLLFSAALVLFLTASPIALSYLLHEQSEKDDEDDERPSSTRDKNAKKT